MEIYDRSVLEKLYNACITDNINLEIGIYKNIGNVWEYVSPDQRLYRTVDYKALFELSNIGIEIDFKDVQLRVKKTEDTLPIKLYKELGQEPVERVDFKDIGELRSSKSPIPGVTEKYRTVYFRPDGDIKADERDKLFKVGVYATVVPQGHHWQWADQREFSVPTLDVPEELNFGDVSFTRTLTKTIKLGNIGEGDLTITEIVLGESSDFDISDGLSLPYTISHGRNVPLSVAFSPSGVGRKRGTLTIQCTDPANPTVTISLVGEGVHSFRAIPDSINFDEVIVSKTETRRLRFQNDGQKDVEVRDIHVRGTYFSCDVSQLTVRAGSAAYLDISFSPNINGIRTGKLTAVSNYSPKPEIEITLSGEGISWLSANPGAIDFGNISLDFNACASTTISNTGPSSCEINRLKILCAYEAKVEFKLGPLPGELPITLGRGGRLDLGVWAKPTGLGVQKGTLIIS